MSKCHSTCSKRLARVSKIIFDFIHIVKKLLNRIYSLHVDKQHLSFVYLQIKISSFIHSKICIYVRNSLLTMFTLLGNESFAK